MVVGRGENRGDRSAVKACRLATICCCALLKGGEKAAQQPHMDAGCVYRSADSAASTYCVNVTVFTAVAAVLVEQQRPQHMWQPS